MNYIEKYKGAIEFISNSEDFYHDYQMMGRALSYRKKNTDETEEQGLILSDFSDSIFIKTKINKNEYEKLFCNTESVLKLTPTIHGLLSATISFYSIEILCGYIEDIDKNGDCLSNIVFLDSNKIFSIDCETADMIALSMIKIFPVFIKTDLWNEYGLSKMELKKDLE